MDVEGKQGRVGFSHALIRETLYRRPSAMRRAYLHTQAGDALEALPSHNRETREAGTDQGPDTPDGPSCRASPNPAELAHHFFEARHIGRRDKALHYSLKAATEAAKSHAYEGAVEHYKRALEVLELAPPPDDRPRCEILLSLGWVQWQAGDPETRATFANAADSARRNGFAEHLARAAMGFAGPVFEVGIVDEDAVTLLEEAGDALGEEHSPLRARLLARLADCLLFTADKQRATAVSRTAVEIARATDDTEGLLAALRCGHAARLHIAHVDERLQLSGELVTLAEQTGYPEFQALGHSRRTYDLIEAGAVEEARGEHSALSKLAEQLRQPLYRHLAVTWETVFALMGGRFDEVESQGRVAYDLAKQAQMRDADTRLGGQIAMLRLLDGRLPELLPAIESFIEQYPALVAWRALLALAYLEAGQQEQGIEEFERLAQDSFASLPRDMLWLTGASLLAETCGLIRDADRAPVLYEILVPHRERNVQVGFVACLGSVERFLGLLCTAMSKWELATEHYEAALTRNLVSGIRSVVPLVHRDHAEMLLARGRASDPEGASELLLQSLRTANELGMSVLPSRIQSRMDQVTQQRNQAT